MHKPTFQIDFLIYIDNCYLWGHDKLQSLQPYWETTLTENSVGKQQYMKFQTKGKAVMAIFNNIYKNRQIESKTLSRVTRHRVWINNCVY
jgi:hypothetical protein